jgi:hypothetical protein
MGKVQFWEVSRLGFGRAEGPGVLLLDCIPCHPSPNPGLDHRSRLVVVNFLVLGSLTYLPEDLKELLFVGILSVHVY